MSVQFPVVYLCATLCPLTAKKLRFNQGKLMTCGFGINFLRGCNQAGHLICDPGLQVKAGTS